MPELPAENNQPDYVATDIRVSGPLAGRRLVIPRDVTALEAAGLAAFLAEWSVRMVSYQFDVAERLKHYGLERFLVAEEGVVDKRG